MKIRPCFVSNSSSSSFILKRKYISEEQWEKIKNRKQVYRDLLEDCMKNPHKIDDLPEELHYQMKNYLRQYKNFYSEKAFWEEINKPISIPDGSEWFIFLKEEVLSGERRHERWVENLDIDEDWVLFTTIQEYFPMDEFLEYIGVDMSEIIEEKR